MLVNLIHSGGLYEALHVAAISLSLWDHLSIHLLSSMCTILSLYKNTIGLESILKFSLNLHTHWKLFLHIQPHSEVLGLGLQYVNLVRDHKVCNSCSKQNFWNYPCTSVFLRIVNKSWPSIKYISNRITHKSPCLKSEDKQCPSLIWTFNSRVYPNCYPCSHTCPHSS
jgi:hypothetical protein